MRLQIKALISDSYNNQCFKAISGHATLIEKPKLLLIFAHSTQPPATTHSGSAPFI